MSDQAEVTRWAGLVATTYADSCHPPLSPVDRRDLAAELDEPLSHCIMLAIPPSDWGPHYINPALERWERKVRRPRGRRLAAADYGLSRITMT
jgi:hypothetical protein